MSLNNIQLSAASLQELYKKSLVSFKNKLIPEIKSTTATLSILGKNLKKIILVVNNEEAAFLTDTELNFLLDILAACKLNMEDVGIVNLQKNKDISYDRITKELGADKIFMFGVAPAEIRLPLTFPVYQVQSFKNQTYLAAPSLQELQLDKEKKIKLWNSLKTIFSI